MQQMNPQKNSPILKQAYKYLMLITTVYITLHIVTAFVQNRLVTINHVDICAAIFIYPITYLISDIVTEIYGYKVARSLLWYAIFSWLLTALLVEMVIHLPSPRYLADYANKFDIVMSPMFRSIMSGTVAVLAGQFLNIYIISKWKVLTRGRYFWMRSVGSSLIGDFITTFLAIIFIFVGRMSWHNIIEVASYEYSINIIFDVIGAFFSSYIVAYLKQAENSDAYDYQIDFNPFKLAID